MTVFKDVAAPTIVVDVVDVVAVAVGLFSLQVATLPINS
jgi:hypothetical protein